MLVTNLHQQTTRPKLGTYVDSLSRLLLAFDMQYVLRILVLVIASAIFAAVLWICFRLPFEMGAAIALPIVLFTFLFRLLVIIHASTALRFLSIPVGLAGGIVGSIFGPIGFVCINAIGNPYIAGAQAGVERSLIVLPLAISFGLIVSLIFWYAFSRNVLENGDT